MPAKLKVAVLGATGYSGLELTRLLLRHPQVEKPVLLHRPENPHPSTSSGQAPSKIAKDGAPVERTQGVPHSSRALGEKSGHSESVNLADIFPVLSGNGSYPLQPLSWST